MDKYAELINKFGSGSQFRWLMQEAVKEGLLPLEQAEKACDEYRKIFVNAKAKHKKCKLREDQKYITINKKKFIADCEFIPLLKEMNKVGLETIEHCSGHGKFLHYLCLNMEHMTIRIEKSPFGKQLLLLKWPQKK